MRKTQPREELWAEQCRLREKATEALRWEQLVTSGSEWLGLGE